MAKLKRMHEDYCERTREFTLRNKEVYDEYEMIDSNGKDPVSQLTIDFNIDFSVLDVKISKWL